MKIQTEPQLRNASATNFSAGRSLLLQRKCACGSPTSSLTGTCPECGSKKRLQTKLSIGASNDPLEQEADRVSDQVMRMPEPDVQRQADYQEDEGLLQSRPLVQRKSFAAQDREAGPPATVHETLGMPGQPLGMVERQFFEPRFGHDFSQVRVHTTALAGKSARAVHAKAYTVGRNIAFAEGQYSPGTFEGRRLLAHELTHVLQQGVGEIGSNVERESRLSSNNTAECENLRLRRFGHRSVSVMRETSSPLVQRKEFGDNVKFDSIPGDPSRAYVLGPYSDASIAAELYGDPTIPVESLSEEDLLIAIDLEQLLPKWKPFFNETTEEETAFANQWPFPGFSADEKSNYVDERATAVAINLVLGVMALTIEGLDKRIEIPLSWVDATDREVIPIIPVAESRAAAEETLANFHEVQELSGGALIAFYRHDNGLIFPTSINPQTAPGIMSVYAPALESARKSVKATEEAFVELAFWYIGARFIGGKGRSKGVAEKPPATKTPVPPTAAAVAQSLAEIVDELYAATSTVKGNGPRFIKAATLLSSRGGLTALQKVEVIKAFATRIGFGFSKQGVVEARAEFLLYSEDGIYAFKFIKDTGRIFYGKIPKEALAEAIKSGKDVDYLWTLL